MNNTYTDNAYWEKYYARSSVEKANIKRICSQYDRFWDLLVRSCDFTPQNIIEIGAYPGRYIAYLAARYNLRPTALDFNSDRKKVEEAFRVMNVPEYEIIQADFLTYQPTRKYDLVYSLGFIEHFENYDEVMDKHVQLLRPGGSLLIMVPNKRWFRKIYGVLCDYNNLKMHNLKCMKLSVFREFAQRNNLKLVYLNYFGGFPYAVHQPLNIPQKVIYKITRTLFKKINPWIARRPNQFLSSSIIGIFHKGTG